MPNVYEPLVLEIEPPYIGSAFSPTVDITETSDDVTVTITDSRGEHSYTVDKTDQAIADAEAAADNANQAAQDAQSAVDAASTAATRANESATSADNAASAALAAKVDTEAATSAANAAAGDASAAASTANASAANADAKAELANTAASNADAKATLANTAASNADAKATLANNAATSATSAASDASTAATNATNAAQAATEAVESLEDGVFPNLTAGMADSLFGETETLVTFPHVSEYSGAARIASIRGNTVVENGSLLSVNIEGIESAGVTREIPLATYFLDGLRSAGSVYDELTSDKAITRIGSVDLGALEWSYEDTTPRFISYGIQTSIAKPPDVNTVANITCTLYESVTFNTIYIASTNNVIAVSNSGVISIKNTSYTDAASFKAAMNGVMLYYELATPTETAIDPPLNMSYPVEQGGTESIVIPTGEQSAPPTMAVVYAYNADGVRDISQAIIANIEGATASTNYAIGGYFVHAGKLYRATSAIATGETINPGTNCTQTTVMAELVRLTA